MYPDAPWQWEYLPSHFAFVHLVIMKPNGMANNPYMEHLGYDFKLLSVLWNSTRCCQCDVYAFLLSLTAGLLWWRIKLHRADLRTMKTRRKSFSWFDTVDGRNPAPPGMYTGANYLSTGAGFFPSTVAQMSISNNELWIILGLEFPIIIQICSHTVGFYMMPRYLDMFQSSISVYKHETRWYLCTIFWSKPPKVGAIPWHIFFKMVRQPNLYCKDVFCKTPGFTL